MPAKRQNESFKKVAEDLELLCIKEDFTSMGRAKELREKKVATLKESNGTLEKVSSYWSIEVKHTYLTKTEDMQNYNFYISWN